MPPQRIFYAITFKIQIIAKPLRQSKKPQYAKEAVSALFL